MPTPGHDPDDCGHHAHAGRAESEGKGDVDIPDTIEGYAEERGRQDVGLPRYYCLGMSALKLLPGG